MFVCTRYVSIKNLIVKTREMVPGKYDNLSIAQREIRLGGIARLLEDILHKFTILPKIFYAHV